MLKRILIPILSVCYLLLLRWTCRFDFQFIDDKDKNYFKNKQQFLLAFFHQDELSLIPCFAFLNIGVLVSISKDGQLMAKAANFLGYITVRGSSSRKAVSGLIAAIKLVKKGYSFSMAVDGPKGPIYIVKPGVNSINEKTGIPIMPVRAYPAKYYELKKAWNKARIPRPFSKIVIKIGQIKNYSREELEFTLKQL